MILDVNKIVFHAMDIPDEPSVKATPLVAYSISVVNAIKHNDWIQFIAKQAADDIVQTYRFELPAHKRIAREASKDAAQFLAATARGARWISTQFVASGFLVGQDKNPALDGQQPTGQRWLPTLVLASVRLEKQAMGNA